VPGLLGKPKLLDLVLESQFASLEIRNLQRIHRGMPHGCVELALQLSMLALQFCEMGFKRHDGTPFVSRAAVPQSPFRRRNISLPPSDDDVEYITAAFIDAVKCGRE